MRRIPSRAPYSAPERLRRRVGRWRVLRSPDRFLDQRSRRRPGGSVEPTAQRALIPAVVAGIALDIPAVEANGRRAREAKTGGLRSISNLDLGQLRVDPARGEDLSDALECRLPMRAACKGQDFDLHRSILPASSY